MKQYAVLVLWFVWGSASAIPVTWNLENVVFDDGGAATGSFVYDADTDTYSDVDIVTTADSIFPGQHYQYGTFFLGAGGAASGFTPLDQADLTGLPALAFFYEDGEGGFGSMTNAGGTLILSTAGGEGYCAFPNCSGSTGEPDLREFVSGSITAVPIPAAVWMFGSALAGLGWFRRRAA